MLSQSWRGSKETALGGRTEPAARVGLVVGLLPIPSGLCSGATFRRARPPACHSPPPCLPHLRIPSLTVLPFEPHSQCGYHHPHDGTDSHFWVPRLPEPSQVLGSLSCISSVCPRKETNTCLVQCKLELLTASHWRYTIYSVLTPAFSGKMVGSSQEASNSFSTSI